MKKHFVIVPFIFISSIVYSAEYSIGKLKYVQKDAGSTAHMQPINPWTSKQGCANSWIRIDTSSPAGEAMYATALSAFLSDISIRIRVSGKYKDCSYYDKAQMIRLYK